MKLLLDTHVLLWWHHEPSRLTEASYDAIRDAANQVFLSVVKGWEMQIKAQLGKLALPKPLSDLLRQEQEANDFRILSVTMDHVDALAHVPLHQRDPFDRLFIAQAHEEGCTLVTHDPKLSAYSVPLLW